MEVKKSIAEDGRIRISIRGIANYKYENCKLTEFCHQNGLKYINFYGRIYYFCKKNEIDELKLPDLIKNTLYKMSIKQKYHQIRMILNHLSTKEVTYSVARQYCEYLNINYIKVKRLSLKLKNITLRNLMILAYYSADKKDINGQYISKKRVDELLQYENCDINDYIGLFRINYLESWTKLDDRFSFLYKKMIRNNLERLGVKMPKDIYEDILKNAQYLFFKSCKDSSSNIAAQIVTYIQYCLTHRIRGYIFKNYAHKEIGYEDTLINSQIMI